STFCGTVSTTATASANGATAPRRSRSRPSCAGALPTSTPWLAWSHGTASISRRSMSPMPTIGCGCAPISGPTSASGSPPSPAPSRLDGALAIAQELALRIDGGDAAEWLERALAARRERVATVVFHSIVWHYAPRATQQRIKAALQRAGASATADSPLAHLQFE